ncbi:hypothetical protein UVI_02040820 [Ustilaginoidea virens]|nr:hypothetical protein UVI_02040820 [Ustilaginoidea virens]
MEPCEADEQFPEGIDGSFVRWAEDLRNYLLQHHPDPQGRQPIPDDEMLPPKWSLLPALDRISNTPSGGSSSSSSDAANHVPPAPPLDQLLLPNSLSATIAANERLTPPSHWQDVRLLTLAVSNPSGSPLNPNPGDCLTIYPKNFPADVQRIIGLMKWDFIADRPLDLTCCSLPPGLHTISTTCSLRDLLLHNVDIHAVPRRSFFKNISYFSDNRQQKDRLAEFATAEFLDEYFDYATRSKRTIIEVLEEFSSVRVPAHRLLDVFPLIRGRDFSIANYGNQCACPPRPLSARAPSYPPQPAPACRVQLVAALVKYRTILRKPRTGLCSNYIAHLPLNTTLSVTVKPVLSPIHGPANAKRPLVAIATGTGIAPVRALIQERLTHPGPHAPMLLFFGNRNQAADYLFAEEWESIAAAAAAAAAAAPDAPLAVFTAFSRDQREKVYVQDLVRQQAARVADLIPSKPIFMVCGGSSKMADACKRAVLDAIPGAGEEEPRKKLSEAITWWQEIW